MKKFNDPRLNDALTSMENATIDALHTADLPEIETQDVTHCFTDFAIRLELAARKGKVTETVTSNIVDK